MSSSRSEGCTLTGALSITTAVRDAVSIIHGPRGCAHHNFSLFHTVAVDRGRPPPRILSSMVTEKDVVFGGEEALERALHRAVQMDPACIFVLTSCVADTIGDDTAMVCREDRPVPVVHIPTSGFLGGGFHDGERNALIALATMEDHGRPAREGPGGITLVGEKNLEYEVDQNYAEIVRLLSLLGVEVRLRFVREIDSREVGLLGRGSLNILRETGLTPVGEALEVRFGTPFISSFPLGLEGTLVFLSQVAESEGKTADPALEKEKRRQRALVEEFGDIRGRSVRLEGVTDPGEQEAVRELAELFDLSVDERGASLPLPSPFPAGTSGVRRVLHRWRARTRA
ncbi:nitrogenase molybdenum-iron protein alpha/beta subunit [Methanolinea mesophila]|uniref:nitrogenase component 1 n=1 Tax=Methanolinea mesophila TaxID=547055 RepID=UPI001AE685CE|nr:nitrogenase component 1 [Methanolinea mesophila]MBP1927659.1 nitrogenase molybdenum-iron protein alpha/beta subunit [Methanolinea mesophila]